MTRCKGTSLWQKIDVFLVGPLHRFKAHTLQWVKLSLLLMWSHWHHVILKFVVSARTVTFIYHTCIKASRHGCNSHWSTPHIAFSLLLKDRKNWLLYPMSVLLPHSSHSFFSCGPSDRTSKDRGMFDGLLDSRRPDNTSPGDTSSLSLICHPMQVFFLC